jgi:hypothetical protein
LYTEMILFFAVEICLKILFLKWIRFQSILSSTTEKEAPVLIFGTP